MSRRVVITSAGVISPLGRGLPQTSAALVSGANATGPVTLFDVSRTRAKTAGEVPTDWITPYLMGRHRLHRASGMLMFAMDELHATDPDFRPELAVIGTTSGGMSFGEEFYQRAIQSAPRRSSGSLLANYAPQKAVLDALQVPGWNLPVQIIANACASGSNAIGHAFQLIRSGLHQRVLCGGYDALSELVYVGFDALQASAPAICRPFDSEREGLVLGEGAALLALEERDAAITRGAQILGEVTGYGISTDNYHLTQPNPSGIGPQRAMEKALRSANLTGSQIDYINAHGTATRFNDATEGIAITNVCPGTPVSSTKGMMGHSLGAAGAIEAVFVLIALREQFFPPNIHFRAPEPGWNFEIVSNASRRGRIQRALSNSFGFGGTNATIVMEGV